jgi:galactokinase
VNLIGEHTDYADGFVLPIAIDLGVRVAAAHRPDRRLRCWSLQRGEPLDQSVDDLGPGRVDSWAAYPAGVAWALAQAGVAVGGADLVIDGDVPAGAGLSSSAALECATALALADLFAPDGRRPDRVALARIARRAEIEAVGMPCGVMDQMISMLGRAGHALFVDTRTLAVEQVPLPVRDGAAAAARGPTEAPAPAVATAAVAAGPATTGLAAAAGGRVPGLLVIDTGEAHSLVEGAYAERRAAVERAARVLGVPALRDADPDLVESNAAALGEPGLRRARHVLSENARVLEAVALLRAGRLDRVGPLLVASHASLRDDFEVSSPRLDIAVEAALAAGALGARMTGAGFGGSALALVPAGLDDQVTAGVNAAFEAAGFERPATVPVRASGGARRIA